MLFMTASLDGTLKKTEHNLIVRIGKSDAEVIIKDYARDIALLKLCTDRHEASRGLSATAELLVSLNMTVQLSCSYFYDIFSLHKLCVKHGSLLTGAEFEVL